jgi:hypothetical protein
MNFYFTVSSDLKNTFNSGASLATNAGINFMAAISIKL